VVYDTLLNGNTGVYLSYTLLSPFGSVRFTGEDIAKQMKATTALKGKIFKKPTITSQIYHIA